MSPREPCTKPLVKFLYRHVVIGAEALDAATASLSSGGRNDDLQFEKYKKSYDNSADCAAILKASLDLTVAEMASGRPCLLVFQRTRRTTDAASREGQL